MKPSMILLALGCALLTFGCARGQTPSPRTATAQTTLGPFHLGMTTEGVREACQSAGGVYASPNRHRRTRGCRGDALTLGGAPVDHYVLRLDAALQVELIEVRAPSSSARLVTAHVTRAGGEVTLREDAVLGRVGRASR